MKCKFRVIALTLVVTLLMSTLVAFPASAKKWEPYEEFKVGDFVFAVASVDHKNCTLDRYVGKEKVLKIPSKAKGFTVTAISSISNKYIEKVNIPNTVTSITSFENCKNLKTLNIPDSVKTIGQPFVSGCPNLTKITFGKKVRGLSASITDSPIQKVVVSPQNKKYSSKNGVLFNKNKTTLILYPDGKTNKNYTMPNTVKKINTYAFSGNKYLENVKLSKRLKKIESLAFYKCKKIKNITIPSVKTIESSFFDCTALEKVTFGKNVNYISPYIFDESSDLEASRIKEIVVSSKNKSYSSKDGVVFNKEKSELILYPSGKIDKNYTIPKTVKKIGISAFMGNRHLEYVKLPNRLKKIEYAAFYGCTNIKTMTIPKSVKYMGEFSVGVTYNQGEGMSINKDFTLNGYKDTIAQKYAKEYRIKFVALK